MTFRGKGSLFIPLSWFFFAITWLFVLPSYGKEPIGVLYPAASPPYDQVYLSIIEALEQQAESAIVSRSVEKSVTPADILAWSQANDIAAYVGLGRRTIKLVPPSATAVFGGSSFYPSASITFSAVSLVPSPACLLSELNKLRPDIRVIHSVATPKYAQYLALANENANEFGMVVEFHESDSLKTSAKHYKRLLSTMNPKQEALWLLGGVDKALFKNILKSSWQRRLVVFSNSVAHVKKGSLFTCYGDFSQHATTLLATLKEKPDNMPVFKLADKPLRGINVRTAKHLGIRLSTRKRYSLTFPME